MKMLIHILFHWIASVLRERWYLQLEHLALLHQVEVLKRSAKRPRFESADRCLWVLLSQWWPAWPHALEIVQADTVRKWNRQGMWHHVKWRRGRKRPRRPPIPADTRDLIRAMSRDNVLWGAPRIHGELAKLGINVSRTTVAKYMIRRSSRPSPTWRTFWRLHAPDLLIREVYAELSGQLRAVYTQGLLTVRHRLWRRVSGWLKRNVCRHVIPITQATDPDVAPVMRPRGVVQLVRALGRSPPESRRSSIDPPLHLYSPITTGGLTCVWCHPLRMAGVGL